MRKMSPVLSLYHAVEEYRETMIFFTFKFSVIIFSNATKYDISCPAE